MNFKWRRPPIFEQEVVKTVKLVRFKNNFRRKRNAEWGVIGIN